MDAEGIALFIAMVIMVTGFYITYRVIRECNKDEDDDEIWS